MKIEPHRLNEAIQAIYPDIECKIYSDSSVSEMRLWWELSACILSSQVSYDLAMAMADEIASRKLLIDKESDESSLYIKIKDVLATPVRVGDKYMRHRFYNEKSRQITKCYVHIIKNYGSLQKLIDSFTDHFEARDWLIENMPGLGPKQASMFLRNTGASYDLAILDRHVLNYMKLIGIYDGKNNYISSKKKYLYYESLLAEYAQKIECKIGLLDWAIWVVMRVIEEKKEFNS